MRNGRSRNPLPVLALYADAEAVLKTWMSFVALLNLPDAELAAAAGHIVAASSPHQEVLQSIQALIAGGAHPSCASCHYLAAALDGYPPR